MDRKELYLNVRKAYRLAYEVQDSIVDMVEYIRERIHREKSAGKPLFSYPIETCRIPEDDYANHNIGYGMWSWDYFPTYMYTYYFTLQPTETQYCCFSIIQVMDDGFIITPDEDSAPSTKGFKDPADSESYLLFAFSIWEKTRTYIWFNRDEKGSDHVKDERAEIIRISETIKGDGNKPYVVSNTDSTFVVTRMNLESFGSKTEADRVLQDFAKLVQGKTGYQLLIDETQEDTPRH
jgi:hypothetical protein